MLCSSLIYIVNNLINLDRFIIIMSDKSLLINWIIFFLSICFSEIQNNNKKHVKS